MFTWCVLNLCRDESRCLIVISISMIILMVKDEYIFIALNSFKGFYLSTWLKDKIAAEEKHQNNLKLPFHKTSGRKLLNFTTNMYIQGVLHMSDFSSSSKTRSWQEVTTNWCWQHQPSWLTAFCSDCFLNEFWCLVCCNIMNVLA